MPCVAHLMLVMLRLTPCVAHLMLVMVLNLLEQCSFQDLLFHLLFLPKSAEKSASRMDITLPIYLACKCFRGVSHKKKHIFHGTVNHYKNDVVPCFWGGAKLDSTRNGLGTSSIRMVRAYSELKQSLVFKYRCDHSTVISMPNFWGVADRLLLLSWSVHES